MKLALVGDGAMGQLVAKLAKDHGHEIAVVFNSHDAERTAEDIAGSLKGCDVAIDFSVAAAVVRNVEACAIAGVPLAEGTTGWHTSIDDVRRIVNDADAGLFTVELVCAHNSSIALLLRRPSCFSISSHTMRSSKKPTTNANAMRLPERRCNWVKSSRRIWAEMCP